jgi:integrase
MAAPTDPEKVAEVLRMVDAFAGGPVVGAALRLLPLLFVRPGELRTMRWEQIDFEAKEWRYTTSKTKTEHLVPLSKQALAILEDLRPLTGHLPGGWVFPGGRSPKNAMSDAAINAAYRRLGIDTRNELTGHGWRACARTLLHEQLGYVPEIIEHQLAHAVPDALGRAYNRTRFIEQRKKMMQAWADYLDRLREGAKVVPFKKQTA